MDRKPPEEPRSFDTGESEGERVAAELRAQIERLKLKVRAFLPPNDDAGDQA